MSEDAAALNLSALAKIVADAAAALATVEKYDGILPAPVPEVIAALDSVLNLAAKILAKL